MKRLSEIRLTRIRPDRNWRSKGLSAWELNLLLPDPVAPHDKSGQKATKQASNRKKKV